MEPLADWLADRLAEVVRQNSQALEADVVMPVPLHKVRGANADSTRRGIAVKTTGQAVWLPHQAVLFMRKEPSDLQWSGGRQFVVLLPHVRAAKLTSSASYW
jgi:hypothetical protein